MKTASKLIVLVMLIQGCSNNPDKVAIREGMYQGTATIRQQHKDWAGKLVRQADGTDKRAELPQLTQNEYDQIMKTHADFEDLVSKDRQRDIAK
jgi:hypothetical protein